MHNSRLRHFVLLFAFGMVLMRFASAADLPPEAPSFADGLTMTEFYWTDIAVHPVSTKTLTGDIRLQALLPEDMDVKKKASLPLASGIELRFLFALQPKESADSSYASFAYRLEVPTGAAKWLRRYENSDLLSNMRQSISGATYSMTATVDPGQMWYLPLSVNRRKMSAGDYRYAFDLDGKTVAQGVLQFTDPGTEQVAALERKASIFFLAAVAYPHFQQWIVEHGGRMLKTSQAKVELQKLPYFPSIEYKPRLPMPRTYSRISDPSSYWLVREVDTGHDGKIVVCFADGTIGLRYPTELRRR